MESAPALLGITRQYLAVLEQMATGDALARFFSPEVVQEEFPNRLVPQGRGATWPCSSAQIDLRLR